MLRLLSLVGIPTWLAPIILGGIVAFAVLGYNTWENASIRKETRLVVEAEAERNTMEAMNGIANKAEQARLKLRFCARTGKLYNFQTNQCE